MGNMRFYVLHPIMHEYTKKREFHYGEKWNPIRGVYCTIMISILYSSAVREVTWLSDCTKYNAAAALNPPAPTHVLTLHHSQYDLVSTMAQCLLNYTLRNVRSSHHGPSYKKMTNTLLQLDRQSRKTIDFFQFRKFDFPVFGGKLLQSSVYWTHCQIVQCFRLSFQSH